MLVGREGVLARLDAALESAAAGQGAVLLLVGEAGAGKTALLAEIAERAGARGFGTGRGVCVASATAYQPVAKALRDLGSAFDPSRRERPRVEALLLASSGGFSVHTSKRSLEVRYREDEAGTGVLGEGSSDTVLDRPAPALSTAVRQLLSDVTARLPPVAAGQRATIDASGFQVAAVRGAKFAAAGLAHSALSEDLFSDLEMLVDAVEDRYHGESAPAPGTRDSWVEGEISALLGRRSASGAAAFDVYLHARQAIRQVARRRPALLLIDSAECADRATVRLLEYLSRNLEGERALVVVAARPSSTADEFSGQTQGRISLDPLPRELAPEIAAAALGRVVAGGAFYERLHRLSGGQPGRMLEWLDSLVRSGALRRGEDGLVEARGVEWKIPARLQVALVSSLSDLSPTGRELLDAASIAGVEFAVPPVSVLIGRSADELEPVLRDLSKRGVLRPDGIGYSFRDPSLRDALRDLVPGARRLEWHRKLADFLAGTDGDVEEVALHLAEARDPRAAGRLTALAREALGRNDVEHALDLAYRVASLVPAGSEGEGESEALLGEVLERRGSFVQAAEHLLRAAACASRGDPRRITAMLAVARAHTKAKEYEESLAIAERVLAESGDRRERAQATICKVSALKARGSIPEALAALAEAESAFAEVGDKPGLATVHHLRGTIYYETTEARRAIPELLKALELRRELGEVGGIAGTCNNLGLAYRALGDLERAFRQTWEALGAFQRLGDAGSSAACYCNLGFIYFDRGELAPAASAFRRSIDFFDLSGHPSRAATALSGLVDVEHARGALRKAVELGVRSAGLKVANSWEQMLPPTLCALAEVYIDLGDTAEITRLVEQGHEITSRYPGMEAESLILQAVDRLSVEDGKAAAGLYRKALRHLRSMGEFNLEPDLRIRIAESCLLAGDPVEALEEAASAEAVASSSGRKLLVARAKRLRGTALLARGETAEAETSVRAALELAKTSGARLEAARDEREIARVVLGKGRTEEARARLIRARDAFDEMGASPDRELCEQVLGQIPPGVT